MTGKIYIIGIGPGASEFLTKKAIDTVKASDYTVGSTRAIELFDECVVAVGAACLMPCNRQSFCEWLKSVDPDAEIRDMEATSVALSIGVTFAEGKVESILFAKEGYYA